MIERDQKHLLRALELAARARGRTSPNPLVGAVVVKNGRPDRRGVPRAGGPAPRRADRARRVRGGPGRRDDVRVARAVRPRGPDAALHGRDPRGEDRARRRGQRRPDAQGERARPRDPARRGRRGRRRERRRRRAGAAAQPAVPQARPDRAPARRLQGGDDPRRQGRHRRPGDSKWISNEASRARAHRWRAEVDAVAVGHPHGDGGRPAPHVARRRRRQAARPRRLRLRGQPEARLAARGVDRAGAADRGLLAGRARAPRCRRSSPPART